MGATVKKQLNHHWGDRLKEEGNAVLLHMSLLGLLPEPSKDGSGPVTKKLNAYSSALSLCFPTHTVTFLFSAQPHYRLSETNFNND